MSAGATATSPAFAPRCPPFDDQLNGDPQSQHPQLYRQPSNDSFDLSTMALSRIASLPAFSGSSSFAADATSQSSIQTENLPQYPDPLGHGMPTENTILTTRSGKTFQFPSAYGFRSENKVRVFKAPRVRRRTKNEKVEKEGSIEVPAPLSELTKDMDIPIRDMQDWVNRPIEVRRQEAKLRRGKIARPMNSFMLYRSAYTERTKKWCGQSNHQVVSKISGMSWSQEPPEIRERYELLALIERDNHQKAHPEYKFAPNKSQTPPRKKRRMRDDGSDGDDVGFQFDGSPNPHELVRTDALKSEFDSRESTPYDQKTIFPESYQNRWSMPLNRPSRLAAPQEQHHPSSYYMNGHGPYPSLLRSSDDTNPTQRSNGYVVNHGYSASTGLPSVPGNINQDLLRPYGSNNGTTVANNANGGGRGHTNGSTVDSQLDPQLLGSGIDMRAYSNVSLPTVWPQHDQDLGHYMPISTSMASNGLTYDTLNATYSMQPLEESKQAWVPFPEDEGIGGSDTVGKDFDQWIMSNRNRQQAVYGEHQ